MTDSSINSSKFDGKGFSILNTGAKLGDEEFVTRKNPQAGSLQSRQFVTILDLLAEGEIAGFATPHKLGIPFNNGATSKYQIIGLKDVFLNKTPVLNKLAPDTLEDLDLTKHFNFGSDKANIPRTVSRTGTNNQTSINFLNQTERELLETVPVKVSKVTPFNKDIVFEEKLDAVRITLKFPTLFSNNGEDPASVEYKIQLLDTNNNVKKTINSHINRNLNRKQVEWFRWADAKDSNNVTYAIYSFNFDRNEDNYKNYGDGVELRFSNFKRKKGSDGNKRIRVVRTDQNSNNNSSLHYSHEKSSTTSENHIPPLNLKDSSDNRIIADKYVYDTRSNPTQTQVLVGLIGSNKTITDTNFVNSITTFTNETVDGVTFKQLKTFDTYNGQLNGGIFSSDDDGSLNPGLNWPRQLDQSKSFASLDDDDDNKRPQKRYRHQNSFKIAVPLNLTNNGNSLDHPEIGAVGTCQIDYGLDFRDGANVTGGASVTGITFSPYFKDHILDFLDNNGDTLVQEADFPIRIRVTRETADNNSSEVANDMIVSGITGLVSRKETYPDFAYTAIRFDAEVFGSMPSRLYRIRGKKVKIPHNATVDIATGSITYSGAFNGTFKTDSEWTNDPAWILFDLLTDARVGMGQQVTDDLIDKFAFFEASKYNNETITGEDGVDKPRFSFNKSFQTPTDAFSLLNQVAESMRASLFVSEGRISLTQDRPADSVYLFSYANVLEGGFGYTGPAQSSRDTIVNVKFFDNEKREFDLVTVNASEVITNSSLETLYGENIRNLEAVGCTDRDQAKRFGRWHIFTQNNQADIVNFSTNAAAGTLLNPGDVITIQDPMKSNKRVSGRVSLYDSSSKTLTLDLFPDGVTSVDPNDKFFIILKTIENQSSITSNHITKLNAESDTESLPFIKKELTISSINATAKTITFSDTDIGNKIQVNTVWVYEKASQTETQDYRIISLSEQENIYSISAVIYDATKYSVIESGDSEEFESNQVLTTLVPPDNLHAEEFIIVEDNKAISFLRATWSFARGISRYLVTLEKVSKNNNDDTNFKEEIEVFTNQYEKKDLSNGRYKLKVQSINFFGVIDQKANEVSFEIKKKKAKPLAPQNLKLIRDEKNRTVLLFDKSTDLDVLFGGNVLVHHLSTTSEPADINNTNTAPKIFDGNTNRVVVDNLTGIYVVKFEDDTGNQSAISRVLNTSSQQDEGEHQLKLVDEADLSGTPFNGTKTDATNTATCIFDNSKSALILTDHGINNSGIYSFENIVDLEQNTNVSIEKILQSTGYYPGITFATRSDLNNLNVSQWSSFASLIATDSNAELFVQVTSSNPSGSSYAASDFTNKDLLPVNKSIFTGRAFKFTLKFNVTDKSQNIQVKKLGFKMLLKERTEININPISNNGASKTVTFNKAFFGGSSNTDITDPVPNVRISLQPDSNGVLQNNETINVTNVKSNQFTVDIKNADGTAYVTRNFNYIAVGFGTISS